VDKYDYLGFLVTPDGVDFVRSSINRIQAARQTLSKYTRFKAFERLTPYARMRLCKSYVAPVGEYGLPIAYASLECLSDVSLKQQFYIAAKGLHFEIITAIFGAQPYPKEDLGIMCSFYPVKIRCSQMLIMFAFHLWRNNGSLLSKLNNPLLAFIRGFPSANLTKSDLARVRKGSKPTLTKWVLQSCKDLRPNSRTSIIAINLNQCSFDPVLYGTGKDFAVLLCYRFHKEVREDLCEKLTLLDLHPLLSRVDVSLVEDRNSKRAMNLIWRFSKHLQKFSII
jgi:hypothetical protein